MGNQSAKSKADPTQEYYQLVANSTITGETWADFGENLRAHSGKQVAIEAEWEVFIFIFLIRKKLAEKEKEKSGSLDLYSSALREENTPKNRYKNILPCKNE